MKAAMQSNEAESNLTYAVGADYAVVTRSTLVKIPLKIGTSKGRSWFKGIVVKYYFI